MSDTIEQQLAAAHARNRDLALSIGNARALLAQHGFQQTPEDTLDVMVARAVTAPRGRVVTTDAMADAALAEFARSRSNYDVDKPQELRLLLSMCVSASLALVDADAGEDEGWKTAALRVGEELSETGPRDYYALTPEQWRAWALMRLAILKGGGEEAELNVSDTPARAEGAGEVTEVSEGVPEYVNNALASLAKAWPVLAQHADHIDGEFSNALDTVKRYVESAPAPLANGEGAEVTVTDEMVLALQESLAKHYAAIPHWWVLREALTAALAALAALVDADAGEVDRG